MRSWPWSPRGTWTGPSRSARAFTVYFHLANLAEEHQRIRQLRERDAGREPVRESLAAAVAELTADAGRAHLTELLEQLRVHLVLTAHPTEARRRAVVAVLRRISELLSITDDQRAGAAERAEARRGLRENVDLLWRTSQLRVKAMDPINEVRTVMTAFDETLFRVVPAVYRELDRALGSTENPVPAFVRFGSWVGADRDGNPFVTAQVTRETATIQADHSLRALETATVRTGRALTLHEATTPPSAGLRRALAAAAAAHPELLSEIAARAPQEPYRTYLLYAAARVSATRVRNADLAYPGPDGFVRDLRVVQESLAAAGAARQAAGELQNLIWQAETFGFHLAGLEVRQHSEVHARVLRELRAAGPPDQEPAGAVPDYSAETQEVLATFRAMAWIQDRFGVDACRRYVVSFTRSAGDIAAVYELARYAAGGGRTPVLDVVPLFESAVDLANAPGVLTGMIALPPVAERLAATGGRLEAMLGYSDSAKELGPASATLRLFDTQARLADWAAAHGIKLTLFHGRRRAGPGRRAGRAGPCWLRRRARSTGRSRSPSRARSSSPGTASRPSPSGTWSRSPPRYCSPPLKSGPNGPRPPRPPTGISPTGSTRRRARPSAGWSRRTGSPSGSPGSARWARSATCASAPGPPSAACRPRPRAWTWPTCAPSPGCSPGRRPGSTCPAGSGWAAGWPPSRPTDGLDVLRRAYREWPLFGVLLDNAEMSLAKTDRPIAARYLALGGRDDLTGLVLAEYDLTQRLVMAVTGHDRLLADRPVLSRAVALRDPYVDALSYLQLRALAALRAPSPDQDRERVERLLLLTVNGVAAGLQNTG